MSRRLDGSDRGYLITGEAVARLAKGIHSADNARRSVKAPKLRTAYDDGSAVRIGKCSADWDKGTCANVDLWEDETACVPGETSPTDTIEDVVNLLFDIAADSWVIIAEGATGQWFVVGVGEPDSACEKSIGGEDMTKWPGWDGTVEQILGHDSSGCLKWFDVLDCSTSPPP